MNIGIDIEEVERFNKYVEDKNRLCRLFSKDEIAYCLSKKKPSQHLAARFCAKEAVWKTLGNNKISVADISVKNNAQGEPEIYIKNKKQKNIKISLSHTKKYAAAFAVKL